MFCLNNDPSASCFAKCDSFANSRGFAIALLVGGMVLGGGMALFGGIGVFTSQNILPQWYAIGTIGHGGCMALFVSGYSLGIMGSLYGAILLIKAKKNSTRAQRPTDHVIAEVNILHPETPEPVINKTPQSPPDNDINMPDLKGWPPLVNAVWENNIEKVQDLLNRGVDVKSANASAKSLFSVSLPMLTNDEAIKALLAKHL